MAAVKPRFTPVQIGQERELLRAHPLHLIDGQLASVGAGDLFDLESSLDGDGAGGEVGALAGFHLHPDAVVERGAGAEAALLVVAHQDELRDAGLREDAGMDPAGDLDLLAVELFDLLGQMLLGDELLVLFEFELDIVERDPLELFRLRREGREDEEGQCKARSHEEASSLAH